MAEQDKGGFFAELFAPVGGFGVTFATSDVEVVSRRMRWHVLVHSILSFAYNTAVIAIVVNVVSN